MTKINLGSGPSGIGGGQIMIGVATRFGEIEIKQIISKNWAVREWLWGGLA